MSASEIDLQQFCHRDALLKPYLTKPFRIGNFSYATNNHIVVRIDADSAHAPCERKLNIDGKAFRRLNDFAFASARGFILPEKAPVHRCGECNGKGVDPDYPDCGCLLCEGAGEINPEAKISVAFGEANFALCYVRQMLALPDIEIATDSARVLGLLDAEPLLFRFAGGVGALLPLSFRSENHIDLQRTS